MKNEIIINKLRNRIELLGYSEKWIARESHVSICRVVNLLNDDECFDTECFIRVCNAIGVDVFDIVSDDELDYDLFCMRVRRYVICILAQKDITVDDIAKECGIKSEQVCKTLRGDRSFCNNEFLKLLWKHTHLFTDVIAAVYCDQRSAYEVFVSDCECFKFEYCIQKRYRNDFKVYV